jgi:hypothetical protein
VGSEDTTGAGTHSPRTNRSRYRVIASNRLRVFSALEFALQTATGKGASSLGSATLIPIKTRNQLLKHLLKKIAFKQ